MLKQKERFALQQDNPPLQIDKCNYRFNPNTYFVEKTPQLPKLIQLNAILLLFGFVLFFFFLLLLDFFISWFGEAIYIPEDNFSINESEICEHLEVEISVCMNPFFFFPQQPR